MKTFSIKEAFKRSWGMWKGHKKLLITATLILFVVEMFQPNEWRGLGIINVILWVIFTIITIGWTKILLKVERGEPTTWKEIFNYTSYFWKYVGAAILLFLIGGIGLILLIVPGVYFLLKYNFVPLIILDKNSTISEAFKESAHLTEGVKWKLLGFVAVSILVIIAGVIALVVGLIVAVPVVTLAHIWIYKRLSSPENAVVEPQIAPIPTA